MYISTLFYFSISFNPEFLYSDSYLNDELARQLILKASGFLPVLLFSGSSSLSFI